MGISKLQKSMIATGIKQLEKWVREEKEGKIDFKLKEINSYLKKEEIPFKILIANSGDEDSPTYTVRLKCQD